MKHLSCPTPYQQRGAGLLQWLVIILVVVFIGLFAFRVVPLYVENKYVESGLKALDDGGVRLVDMNDQDIRKRMANFYLINNVRSEGPTKNINIVRESDRVVVMIDYEARVRLFWNLDVVARFENHLDSRHPTLCCRPVSKPVK
jgi:hypothetical protein